MYLTIHRGTKQIGGSCVELKTGGTRIILDIGMPLTDPEGGKFEFKKYRKLTGPQLVEKKLLPEVKGLYKWDKDHKPVDGLLISHPHLDHYGFWEQVNPQIPFYLGPVAQKIIELDIMAPEVSRKIALARHYKTGKKFTLGGFAITPYLVDHAAADSYALAVTDGQKAVIYSGDIRMHGRMGKATEYFLAHAPKQADVLLLEGTMMGGRARDECPTEEDLEQKFKEVFQGSQGMVLVYCSAQNIARVSSIYRAAKSTGRKLLTDVYGAEVLDAVFKKPGQKIPNIFTNLRVFYPYKLAQMLGEKNPELIRRKYAPYHIGKKEIRENAGRLVILVRPSMVDDLVIAGELEGGDFVYSQWAGYKAEEDVQSLLKLAEKKGMKYHEIHTSGHADVKSLKKIVERLKPKAVAPIHTESPEGYERLGKPVRMMRDGEIETV